MPAGTFRVPSGDIATRLKENPPLAFVHLTNVIGAVGVSGAPGGEKDEVCVKAGPDKVADQRK